MYRYDTDILRLKFALNKDIPEKYEREILEALSHYPELIATRIRFVLADKASVPYGTKPGFASCFKPRNKRLYTVTLLEKAPYPDSEALFKNLAPSMRVAVIGHELAHVRQYHQCSVAGLFKLLASFALHKTRRGLERNADLNAITHGMGEGLLEHALYIRSIPGYVEKRPAINSEYLQPAEIKQLLRQPGKQHAA